jgi:hypothetical protein
MAIYNTILICFLVYYTFFFFRLTIKKERTQIQTQNKKLNELRTVAVKTVEQQKEFIDTKYPKHTKFKFSWKWLGKIIVYIAISILLYKAYGTIFKILGINVQLWMDIVFIIVFPLLVNLILRVFNLEKDDLTVFFR